MATDVWTAGDLLALRVEWLPSTEKTENQVDHVDEIDTFVSVEIDNFVVRRTVAVAAAASAGELFGVRSEEVIEQTQDIADAQGGVLVAVANQLPTRVGEWADEAQLIGSLLLTGSRDAHEIGAGL